MLVGDLIMGLREAATDLSLGTFPTPGAELSAAAVAAASSTLPVTNIAVEASYVTPWGETLTKSLGNVNVLAGQGIQITSTLVLPAGISIAVYLSYGASFKCRTLLTSLPSTITALGGVASTPQRSTAYIADSDGRALSNASVYAWINDALEEAAKLCGGGVPDVSGCPSSSGVGTYVLTGRWNRVENLWYDGYPVWKGNKKNTFRRNAITASVLGNVTLTQQADRTIIEIYPQPARSSGNTTIATTGISATDSAITLASSAGFLLPFGLALIGGVEIVQYSGISGANMTGLIRGIGGTYAQAWPVGTTVRELNVYFDGLRSPTLYQPGDSFKTLLIPAGWTGALKKYLLHRFRIAEKRQQEGMALLKEFQQSMAEWNRTNKPTVGPVQIQPAGSQGVEIARGAGSPFGGVVVP